MKSINRLLKPALAAGLVLILSHFSALKLQSQTTLNFSVNSPAHAVADFGVDYTPNRLQFVFWDSSTTNVVSWYWEFGDGDTSTVQNTSHTYATKGIYTVCLAVTNDKGCVDTICQEINSFLGVENQNGRKKVLSVYPNPSDGYALVSFNLTQKSKVSIDVYSLLGEKISIHDLGTMESGLKNYELSPADFNNTEGLYFLHLNINEKVFIEKLVLNGF